MICISGKIERKPFGAVEQALFLSTIKIPLYAHLNELQDRYRMIDVILTVSIPDVDEQSFSGPLHVFTQFRYVAIGQPMEHTEEFRVGETDIHEILIDHVGYQCTLKLHWEHT